MSSASLIKTPPEKVRVNGWVFYTSTALILLLTAILIYAPKDAGRLLGIAQGPGCPAASAGTTWW